MDEIFVDSKIWGLMGWFSHHPFKRITPMFVIGAKTPITDDNRQRYLYILRVDRDGYYTFFKMDLKSQYALSDFNIPEISTILCSSDPTGLSHIFNVIDFDCRKAFADDCRPPICSDENKLPCRNMQIMQLTPVLV